MAVQAQRKKNTRQCGAKSSETIKKKKKIKKPTKKQLEKMSLTDLVKKVLNKMSNGAKK